jgi:NADPH:quinone reductase-like Zn-dependent oxidoreductase
METHPAVATVSKKGRLAIIQAPTIPPTGNEVRIRVEWAASTPLDLHQNDGGILVTHPQILGDSAAGTVVEVGDQVQRLKVGDKIFGFVWSSDAERGQQVFVTAPEWKFGIVSNRLLAPSLDAMKNSKANTVFMPKGAGRIHSPRSRDCAE